MKTSSKTHSINSLSIKALIPLLIISLLLISGSAQAHTENEVFIETADMEIPGIYNVPADHNDEIPAVLMLHGFASDKDEVGGFYKLQAERLADMGVASLRIDFPGSGDSEVDFAENTVDLQNTQALKAYDWLVEQKEVDQDKVGALGFSLGGVIATNLAVNRPVKALGLWATSASTTKAFSWHIMEFKEEAFQEGSVDADLGWTEVTLSKEFFQSLYYNNPGYDIRDYQNPLLVVAGELDNHIPSDAREFANLAGSFDITVQIIADAGHTFDILEDEPKTDQVLDITTDWFADRLK